MYRSLISLLAVVAAASATTIHIHVGENGNLKFNPASTTAAVGDILAFHFYSGSGGHSVVSSTFANPCVPDSASFFSGYIPGDDAGDIVYEVNVNSTDPIWYFCSLLSHCQSGMVGVINPPAGTELAAYATAAKAVPSASAPAAPIGGVLTTVAAAKGSASSTADTSSSASVSATSSPTATSSSSSAATATKTSNSAGRTFGEGTTVVGLVAVAGGFVAMMA